MFDSTRPPDLWAPPRHPYYVYAPDYLETSSGVFVLHQLCHALNLAGMEAYVTAAGRNPRLRTPRMTSEVASAHLAAGQTPIVVYPEVVTGNPMGAPVVARFILNRPGLLGGEARYAPEELLFTHSQEFLPEGMRAESLLVPAFDLELFRPDGRPDAERRGRYVYASRYLARGGVLDEETRGLLQLSYRAPLPLNQLAGIFRSAERLYAYERSAICTEAMLCGCPVIYVPNEHLRERPTAEFFGDAGAAWGSEPAEVARAVASLPRVRERLLELERDFWRQLRHFVEVTQRAADERGGVPPGATRSPDGP